ncbi:MAG: PepSY-associated TM helix domain-containing protein [Pseudomonadota bacterium]
MHQQTRIRLFDIHSGTGAILGVFLFAVAFTGIAALFFAELEPWERDAARSAMPPGVPALDAALATAAGDEAIGLPSSFFVLLPQEFRPTIMLIHGVHGGVPVWEEFDGTTGAHLGPYAQGAGRFLRNLHTDLHIPGPFGRYLVGFGGVLMLLSIVTGVAIHAKIFRNLHVFRPFRSRRLAWTDAHNVLGVWGLPFHATLAFSGAILGLGGVLLSVVALASFGGDRDKAVAAVLGERPAETGVAVQMASLDAMLADIGVRVPDAIPASVEIGNWGDAGGEARFRVLRDDDLEWFETHAYSLATGELSKVSSVGDSVGGRIYLALTPLHFGSFGGLAMKALYAVLGLALSLVTASGTIIWLERRAQQKAPVAPWLAGATVGAMAGLPLASAAVLTAHHLLPDTTGRVFALGFVCFPVWVLATVFGAWRNDDRSALRALMGATAALLALAPVARLLFDEGRASLMPTTAVAVAEFSMLALAAAIAVAARAVPDRQHAPASTRRRLVAEPLSEDAA